MSQSSRTSIRSTVTTRKRHEPLHSREKPARAQYSRKGVPHNRLSTVSFAAKLFEALDTPVSLSCYLLLKSGEYGQLVRKDISPLSYLDSDADLFYRDYQSVKLLSSFPGFDTGIDTELEALKKFVESEASCLHTNEQFRSRTYDCLNNRVDGILLNAARKISTILGSVPKLEDLDFSFGPGAAFGVRGETSVYNKITSTLECTTAFSHLLGEFLSEFPGWIPDGTQSANLVCGSELVVVPKNAKVGRPICIEPLLNGLYQKGVGSFLKRRLKRFGIDLSDQSRNQSLALKAIDFDLATVDFSSASDTISYNVVMDLLPIDWFQFLDIARSPQFFRDGTWYNFQKFSSMGNAYTFELETLIFYALACACCEELGVSYQTGQNLSVYGDDVIIPRRAYDLFSQVTAVCGFTVNLKKSFSDGVFFESCGHDYFNRSFVRPFQFDKEPNKLNVAFYYANTILRFQARLQKIPTRDFSRPAVDSALRRVYDWCVGCISPSDRLYGPEGYGDGHLITSSVPSQNRDETFDGWWFRSIVEKPIRIPLDEVPIGYALYFNKGKPPERWVLDIREPLHNGGGYSVRSRTKFSRTKVFCFATWDGPGDVKYDEHRGLPTRMRFSSE